MIDQNKEISRVTYNGTEIPIKSEGEEIEWEYFVKGVNYDASAAAESLLPPFIISGKASTAGDIFECSVAGFAYLGLANERLSSLTGYGFKVSPLMADFPQAQQPKGTLFSEFINLIGLEEYGLFTQITKEEYDALGVE